MDGELRYRNTSARTFWILASALQFVLGSASSCPTTGGDSQQHKRALQQYEGAGAGRDKKCHRPSSIAFYRGGLPRYSR